MPIRKGNRKQVRKHPALKKGNRKQVRKHPALKKPHSVYIDRNISPLRVREKTSVEPEEEELMSPEVGMLNDHQYVRKFKVNWNLWDDWGSDYESFCDHYSDPVGDPEDVQEDDDDVPLPLAWTYREKEAIDRQKATAAS